MTDSVREQLHSYITATPQKIEQILNSTALNRNFKRQIHTDLLEQYLQIFLSQSNCRQWIIVPGLRGVGKTTLLAQLYSDTLLEKHSKFYLSFSTICQQIAGVKMADIKAVIEDRLDCAIETYMHPLFLFFDDVHFLPEWHAEFRALIDNSNLLCILCTGSPVIDQQIDADSPRRSDVIKMNPLSFTEFIAIQSNQVYNNQNYQVLSQQIKEALLHQAMFMRQLKNSRA